MRRMSPCTRIMGGRPEDRCRSEALFLTTKARSSEISTIIPFNVRPERNPKDGPKQMKEREFSRPRSHRRADYVLNTLELASREAAHRIRDPGGGQASPIGAIARGEQDVSAASRARGGAARQAGGGVAAPEAARSHGSARADTRRGAAAPPIRAVARAARPAESRRLRDGYALDGHVRGPRGGDRRRRDPGTGGHGDFWRKARLSLS